MFISIYSKIKGSMEHPNPATSQFGVHPTILIPMRFKHFHCTQSESKCPTTMGE